VNIYLQRMQDAIAEATRDMDVAQLARHPEGKWSPAEILEHLDHTYRSTARALRKYLDADSPPPSYPLSRSASPPP
jgi:DinB superfamily